jgi:hypothetical protein
VSSFTSPEYFSRIVQKRKVSGKIRFVEKNKKTGMLLYFMGDPASLLSSTES